MLSTVTGKVQILPDSVSCRIAAGEVVERPASVVKELIDNSLDAGSTLITVEVEEGGRRVIRVIDNGTGMTRMDAQLACQRFATSKLRSEDDLLTLMTMGFRGEALPSIASISRFCLKTIPRDSTLGTQTQSTGGVTWEVQDYTGPQGTQVEVRDLFFNTPGRLKFLKTVPTEFSKICYVVQQAAAVHPEIHFRLRHQNHKVLEYPAVSSLQDRLLQIYGPDFLERFLPVTYNVGSFQLTGYTVSPHHARASRAPQEIFVNGRPIKNSTISHAVLEAYGSFLPKGKHPQFIVFIHLDPRQSISMSTRRNGRFASPIQNSFIRAFFVASKLSFSRNPHPISHPMNTRKRLAQFRILPGHHPGHSPSPRLHSSMFLYSLEAAPIDIPRFLYLSRNRLLSIRAGSSHTMYILLGRFITRIFSDKSIKTYSLSINTRPMNGFVLRDCFGHGRKKKFFNNPYSFLSRLNFCPTRENYWKNGCPSWLKRDWR